jgi:hypothetical protein
VVMYGILVATRVVFVAFFYPLLGHLGYGLSWKEAAVVGWGGVRGPITLTLTIVVDRQFLALASKNASSDGIPDATFVREAEQVTFMLMGIVFMTMLVNGTTLQALTQLVGVMKRTPVETALLAYVHRRFHRAAHHALEDSLANSHYTQASPPTITNHVTSLQPNGSVNGHVTSKTRAAVTKVIMMSRALKRMQPGQAAAAAARANSNAATQAASVLAKKRRREAHPAIAMLLQSSSRQLRSLVDQQVSQASQRVRSAGSNDGDDERVVVKVDRVNERSTSGEDEGVSRRSTSNSLHSRAIEEAVQQATEHDNSMLVAQLRELFLKSLRAAYWQDIESGVIPKGSVTSKQLLSSVEFALDDAAVGLSEFDHLRLEPLGKDGEYGSHRGVLAALVRWLPKAVSRRLRLDTMALETHRRRVGQACYVASCFVDAHEVARSMLCSYIGDSPDSDVDADLAFRAGFGRVEPTAMPGTGEDDTLAPHDENCCTDGKVCTQGGGIDAAATAAAATRERITDEHIRQTLPQLAQVLDESRVQIRKAKGFLTAVYARFPSMVVATENRKVISLILHHQRAFVMDLFKKGLLDYGEMHKLIVRIREDTNRMARIDVPGKLSDINELRADLFNEEPVSEGGGGGGGSGARESGEVRSEAATSNVSLAGERLDGVGRLASYVDVIVTEDDGRGEQSDERRRGSSNVYLFDEQEVRASESRGRSFALDEEMLVLLTRAPNAEDASKLSMQGFVEEEDQDESDES